LDPQCGQCWTSSNLHALPADDRLRRQQGFETCQLFVYLNYLFPPPPPQVSWAELPLFKTTSWDRENNGVMSPEFLVACQQAGQNQSISAPSCRQSSFFSACTVMPNAYFYRCLTSCLTEKGKWAVLWVSSCFYKCQGTAQFPKHLKPWFWSNHDSRLWLCWAAKQGSSFP